MQKIIAIKNYLSGKKTFIVGICAIVYGLYIKSADLVVIGSGLIGIRDGLQTTERNILSTIWHATPQPVAGNTTAVQPIVPPSSILG